MSELRLFSFRRCPFAIRVRMVLEEKAIPYQVIEENLSELSAELLALHPEGRVPLLVHGSQVIYESRIITEYLDEVFPNPILMPVTPQLRAQVRLWTYWCDALFKPDLDLFKYGGASGDALSELHQRLHDSFAQWNTALKNSEYLVGNQMTLADIHLFPFARQFMAVRPSLEGMEQYEYFQRWLTHMVNRPAFLRAMEKKLVSPGE